MDNNEVERLRHGIAEAQDHLEQALSGLPAGADDDIEALIERAYDDLGEALGQARGFTQSPAQGALSREPDKDKVKRPAVLSALRDLVEQMGATKELRDDHQHEFHQNLAYVRAKELLRHVPPPPASMSDEDRAKLCSLLADFKAHHPASA